MRQNRIGRPRVQAALAAAAADKYREPAWTLLRLGFPAAAFGLVLAISGDVPAQSNGPLEIRRYTIDAGGGETATATLHVTATIGQPDANLLSAGAVSLRGGFWAARTVPAQTLFTDGFE